MAWEPDSNVERGLYGSILATKRLAVSTYLVVITDGEQNVKELHWPPLNRYYGMISGFIFGAGDLAPSSIPNSWTRTTSTRGTGKMPKLKNTRSGWKG